MFLFISAESHENVEKLGNENDSKTVLKHHVSINILYYIKQFKYLIIDRLPNIYRI